MLGPTIAPEDASLAVQAVGLSRWHQTHRFCARCGSPTDVTQAGHTRVCPSCGTTHFPRTDPAVIMLVTDGDDRALCSAASRAGRSGDFSTLAGFVEPGESLTDAVRREVLEEVGVEVGDVEFAGSQPWPFPSSLMLGFHGIALTRRHHGRRRRDRGGALVHPRRDHRADGVRRAAAAADRVDLALAGREVARRRDQRQLVTNRSRDWPRSTLRQF